MTKKLLSVLALFCVSTTLLAQNPGTLDSSFGTSGKVVTNLFGNQQLNDLAIQTDGKIVSVGRSLTGNDYNFAVYRHLANGTVDTSFGTNGGVNVDLKGIGGYDTANAVLIQPDGKIIVAGAAGLETIEGDSHFGFIRLNANGTLDTTFGTNGKTSFAVGSNNIVPLNTVKAIKLQSDGKIVAVGSAYNTSSDFDFGVVRLNADGSLDSDFSNDGKFTIDFGSSNENATHLKISESSGKILIAGEAFYNDLGLTLINDDGSLDTTFGINGKRIVDLDSGFSFSYSGVAFQPDGKVLISGKYADDFCVYRITDNGSLDVSFGINGKVTTDLDNGSIDNPSKSILIQPNGGIIVIGNSITGSTDYFSLVRYTSLGQLDTTFSNDGIVLTSFGSGYTRSTSASFQPDGKLVVVGFTEITQIVSLALARYNTGVNLNTDGYSIKKTILYPNPTTDIIAINGNFTDNSSYTVFDNLGREVLKGSVKFGNTTTLNVVNLNKGIYYISIDDSEVVKFIKN